jgi:ADP-L-glycero-D-manno-heptose 6-epimerase
MIVLTGAAGFIGSCMLKELNNNGFKDILLVDDFSREDKKANYNTKKYTQLLDREEFIDFFKKNCSSISSVIHLGARTDTTEKDRSIFEHLNIEYSKNIWQICSEYQIPLVYASSAATYGLGELGYEDSHEIVANLVPLNPYGDSKNLFDIWALQQAKNHLFGLA